MGFVSGGKRIFRHTTVRVGRAVHGLSALTWYRKFGYASALLLGVFLIPATAHVTTDVVPQPSTAPSEALGTFIDEPLHPVEPAQGVGVRAHADNRSSADVSVNGQNVPVPASGHVQKTVTTSSGQANVDVKVSNHSSGQGSSASHTSVQIQATSESNTGGSQSPAQ